METEGLLLHVALGAAVTIAAIDAFRAVWNSWMARQQAADLAECAGCGQARPQLLTAATDAHPHGLGVCWPCWRRLPADQAGEGPAAGLTFAGSWRLANGTRWTLLLVVLAGAAVGMAINQ